jgi:hypothetical protein
VATVSSGVEKRQDMQDMTMSERVGSISGSGRRRLFRLLGTSEELPKSASDVLLLLLLFGRLAVFGLRTLFDGELASLTVGGGSHEPRQAGNAGALATA